MIFEGDRRQETGDRREENNTSLRSLVSSPYFCVNGEQEIFVKKWLRLYKQNVHNEIASTFKYGVASILQYCCLLPPLVWLFLNDGVGITHLTKYYSDVTLIS